MIKQLNKGLGIWQILSSNLITDIIGSSGFDLVIFDLEHGLHNPETIQSCLFAAKASSLFTVARVPTHKYQNIVQLIDTGIDAILFPHVETKEQLDLIIDSALLAPYGEKSFSPFVPRFKYKNNPIESPNPSIGVLIESKLGIKNAELILKNSNIDFIYFGAYDLSVELKKPGKIFDPEIVNLLSELIICCKKANKKIMAIYRTNDELKILLDMGINFPIASVDTSQLEVKLREESRNYNSNSN